MTNRLRSEAELLRVIAQAEDELRRVRAFNDVERIRELEEENRQLRAAMRGKPMSINNKWGLGPIELRMLAAFIAAPRNQILVYDRMIWACKSPSRSKPTTPAVIKTTLYTLRKKVAGLKVRCVWGEGIVVESLPQELQQGST